LYDNLLTQLLVSRLHLIDGSRVKTPPPRAQRHTMISQHATQQQQVYILKTRKKILISTNLTFMCTVHDASTTTMWLRRWQCMKPRIGHPWQFRFNRFSLRTYRHHPVARFPRRRGGRQSEHGQRRGDLGGTAMVDLPQRCALLGDVAKFGNTPPLFCSHGCCWWEGARVLVGSKRGGRKSVHRVDRNFLMCDVWCRISPWKSMLGEKEWGGGMILMCF